MTSRPPNLRISVVVPTFNRADILPKTLRAYAQQTLPRDQFEILIVDDGSVDTAPDALHGIFPGTLRVFTQQHRGANAARNLGVLEACGDYVLFTGDDIIPEPTLLEEHLEAHARYGHDERIAILGYTTWSPEIRVTPLMKYLEVAPILPQFEYFRITAPEDLSHEFFYTSNVSVRRSFLLEHGLFDEEMNKPFSDDGELAYRLRQHGLRINYHPSAKAWHWHEIGLAQLHARAQTAGEMSFLFAEKHPEHGREEVVPPDLNEGSLGKWLKYVVASIALRYTIALKTSLAGDRLHEAAFRTVIAYCYYRGVRKARARRAARMTP